MSSTPIQIAYDASLLGHRYKLNAVQSGLIRVVEQVLLSLAKSVDIEVSVVGLCYAAPSYSSIGIDLYIKNLAELLPIKRYHSYKSRFLLDRLQSIATKLYYSDSLFSLRKFSKASILARGLLSLISIVDSYPFFEAEKFDVLHSPLYPLPSPELTKNLPRVLTIYDMIPALQSDFSSPRFNYQFSKTLKSIDLFNDHIITISEFTKKEFCQFTGMSPDRVFPVHLAAADHFRPFPKNDLLQDILCRYAIPSRPYFLTVATLQPRKNIPFLINCFIRFCRENPKSDVCLVLSGEKGWQFKEIFTLIDRLNEYKDRIVFTGYIVDSDLSAIYSGAVAFIFPSLYEGFGLPPLEAMQCGTPVIVSNTSSLPEVVGDAGILVDPNDEDSLCRAMYEITFDTLYQRDLSHKGLNRAKQFSWQRCGKETIDVYNIAVGNKK